MVSFEQDTPVCDSFFLSCILLLSALNTNNRMMTRAFGHNPCCDNQSSNVFLRGEIKSTLPHFLIPVPSLHVCCILYSREHKCDVSLFFFFLCYLSYSDDSVTTGGAQPRHDVETLHNQTFITSIQSTLRHGTFVTFRGED